MAGGKSDAGASHGAKRRRSYLRCAAVLVLDVFPIFVRAQTNASSQLFSARTLKCQFGPGTTTQWASGKPTVKSASGDAGAVFDAIDLKNHTARVIGNLGARDVTALSSTVGITFIDSEPAVIVATTVFAVSAGENAFLVVDSRHGQFAGTAFTEQYPGVCRIWQ